MYDRNAAWRQYIAGLTTFELMKEIYDSFAALAEVSFPVGSTSLPCHTADPCEEAEYT
jgi:hypothetical protein